MYNAAEPTYPSSTVSCLTHAQRKHVNSQPGGLTIYLQSAPEQELLSQHESRLPSVHIFHFLQIGLMVSLKLAVKLPAA